MYNNYFTLEDFNDLPELKGNSIWENSAQLRLKIKIFAAVERLESGQQFTLNPQTCSFEDYPTYMMAMAELSGRRQIPEDELLSRAEEGDAYAQTLYAKSLMDKGQYPEAFQWACKAADQEDTLGIVLLGHMHLFGVGTEVNYGRAAALLGRGVVELDAIAMTELAMMYKEGLGVERDDRKAFELVECAAYLDHPMAMRNLAWHYMNGVGTPRDEVKAYQWLKKGQGSVAR